MEEPNVIESTFTDVPRGSTLDTFDDHLSHLDGTDPADNLSALPPKAKDKSFPTREEFDGTSEGGDKPVKHKSDDDDEETEAGEKLKATGKGGEKTDDTVGDEDVSFENETQLVESLGYKGVPTVSALVDKIRGEAQQGVDAVKNFFQSQGITLYGRTIDELNRELETYRPSLQDRNKGNRGGDTDKKTTDDTFPTVDALLEEAISDDPASKKFYARYGKAIAGPIQAKMDDLHSQVEQLSNDRMVNEYVADKALYDMAVAATGKDDGPIPSFGEARRLLAANPRARAEGIYRMMNFGNEKDTPFLAIFGQWRAQTNQLGLTNAQVALKRDSGKVAKFTKQVGAGKGPDNLKQRKQDEAAAIAATRKLPVSVLERGR